MIGSEISTSEPETRPAGGLDETRDRRRPGRLEVSPALLPLLRAPDHIYVIPELENGPYDTLDYESDESLRPARGIVVGLLISLPLWAALLATVHTVLRLTFHS